MNGIKFLLDTNIIIGMYHKTPADEIQKRTVFNGSNIVTLRLNQQ